MDLSSYLLTSCITNKDTICVVTDWYGEHSFEIVALVYWGVAAADGEVEPTLRTDGVVVELGGFVSLDG